MSCPVTKLRCVCWLVEWVCGCGRGSPGVRGGDGKGGGGVCVCVCVCDGGGGNGGEMGGSGERKGMRIISIMCASVGPGSSDTCAGCMLLASLHVPLQCPPGGSASMPFTARLRCCRWRGSAEGSVRSMLFCKLRHGGVGGCLSTQHTAHSGQRAARSGRGGHQVACGGRQRQAVRGRRRERLTPASAPLAATPSPHQPPTSPPPAPHQPPTSPP